MAPLSPRNGIGAVGRRPDLPAFCRTRRRTVPVETFTLRSLERLLWVVLLFQLTTVLLVMDGLVGG